jgi:hypothetical protein
VDGVLRYMLPGAIYTAIVPVVGAVATLIFGGILWRAKKLALNIPWNSHHFRC